MKAISIDDELLALDVIDFLVKSDKRISLIQTFQNVSDALKFLRKYPVDLVFLDINMPGISGIEVAKAISKDCMVIFTTAYSEYGVLGFELDAVDYLIKPISQDRFKKAIDKSFLNYKARKNYVEETSYFLSIRADLALHRIDTRTIIAIEGVSDYVKVILKDRPILVARITLKDVLSKLPEHSFMRINRSYIVNLSFIEKVTVNSIYVNGKDYRIGNTFLETVRQKLNN
jgi:DNA-binding LytR/AlgR family response regulator